MMQLIQLFQQANYTITFVSTASENTHSHDLSDLDISTSSIQLNDASFDTFIREVHPTVVLFDRFITEEQFGWRVAEHCPNALRILDTEDLHFLRKARQTAVQRGLDASEADVYTDTAKRELASILRCDLSLIISEAEIKLLKDIFRISQGLLYYLPLCADQLSEEDIDPLPSFKERTHYISIGNFLHAPNLDAVLQLKNNLWPKIKRQLPNAQLHVYGNYAPQQITQLHNEAEGFLIKGWAEDVTQVMKNARVSLVLLRFGAGLKGKIIDAMRCGTPTVTTSIGAEGIAGDLEFGGMVTDDIDAMANAAVELYTDELKWKQASLHGHTIISNRFDMTHFSEDCMQQVKQLIAHLTAHRQQHFIGQILQQQTTQASKYMSKWIEEKNK